MRRLVALVAVVALLVAAAVLTGCGGRTVPDVTGKTQADAVRALQDAGYKLGEVSVVATNKVPLGMIASQSPAAGEKAKEGTAVSLAIASSDGQEVLVPNVTGLTQVEAENVAETLDLTPMTSEAYTSEVDAGKVGTQVPEAGAKVRTGSILVMVVSQGPEPAKAKVPDVVGKAQADAESALKSAGFTVEVFKVYDSKVAKGKVGGQAPDAGASVLAGSNVQIVVSLGPGTGSAKVPSVVGKKEADASSAISSAGLKVKKITKYSSTVATGVVSDQFPSSGSTAAAGSEVLIVVSLGAEPSADVAVPDVGGMTAEEATSVLETAGFTVTAQEVSSDQTAGTVFYQFPEAGAKVAPGSGVLIAIAAAP
jgi:beta-lactam-binding protein with PASTA domain